MVCFTELSTRHLIVTFSPNIPQISQAHPSRSLCLSPSSPCPNPNLLQTNLEATVVTTLLATSTTV